MLLLIVSKRLFLSTTGVSDLKHDKYVGQISSFMRASTSKDGDLLSNFDKINDGDTNDSISNTSLKEMLIDNNTVVANKGKIKGQLPLEHIFGFCKTIEKITKNLGFHLTFKTNDLQNIIFTRIATDFIVTINSLYLFVPILIPNTRTQVLFNESIKNNYTITYDSWYTERNLSTDGNELQVDIGSAQHVNSPKYLIGAFPTEARIGTPNKNNILAIFDNVNVRKYFCEIDGYRYPKDGIITNFPENEYLDQYRDLKLFYKEYLGEVLMNPFISYTNMKNKYPIQVIDLRFQVHHITPKKIQLFEEFITDPVNVNARSFFYFNQT